MSYNRNLWFYMLLSTFSLSLISYTIYQLKVPLMKFFWKYFSSMVAIHGARSSNLTETKLRLIMTFFAMSVFFFHTYIWENMGSSIVVGKDENFNSLADILKKPDVKVSLIKKDPIMNIFQSYSKTHEFRRVCII